MQVQQRGVRSPPFHPHAHPVPAGQDHSHPNGAHSESRPRYSASSTDHLNGDDMNPYHNPYQNPYGVANGPPQQQPRQYPPPPPNQLPPMYPNHSVPPAIPVSMSMPPPMPPPGQGIVGPSTAQHQPIYPAQPQPSAPGLPQPGPGALAAQTQEGPKSLSGQNAKYRFELRVEQQPQRARMCGFGDKDRRPITPPPCVRLLVYDVRTGEIVPHDQVDGSFFVLQVDLWDDNATREVNIVRSSTTSPSVSISTATTTSYPPTDGNREPQYYHQVAPGVFQSPDGLQVFGAPSGFQPPPVLARTPQGHYTQYYPAPTGPIPVYNQPNANMFTRNLIGSLTVNAASLKDTEGLLGYWFVLQDLSVRTEGFFRYVTTSSTCMLMTNGLTDSV